MDYFGVWWLQWGTLVSLVGLLIAVMVLAFQFGKQRGGKAIYELLLPAVVAAVGGAVMASQAHFDLVCANCAGCDGSDDEDGAGDGQADGPQDGDGIRWGDLVGDEDLEHAGTPQ